MKTKTCSAAILSIAAAIGVSVLFQGCATPQTVSVPAQPATTNVVVVAATPTTPAVTNYVVIPAQPATTATTYVPNTTATQVASQINAVAPLIPAPYGTLATGAATLIALVAGWIANKKNNDANAASALAATHAAAAAAMASVIQSQPALVTAALAAANSNQSAGAVAEHLASAASPT